MTDKILHIPIIQKWDDANAKGHVMGAWAPVEGAVMRFCTDCLGQEQMWDNGLVERSLRLNRKCGFDVGRHI